MTDLSKDDSLCWTGERLLPGIGGAIEAEHMHRYGLACGLAAGLDVLDIACGEGYGAKLLATVAHSVLGVDISPQAIAHARMAYPATNLEFRQGECSAIPCDDASIDLVVSFETLEHHDRHHEMLREIGRVLRPGGVVLISCPDRQYFSELPQYRNPFHVKELSRDEFIALLHNHFSNIAVYGQRVLSASLISPLAENQGNALTLQAGLPSRQGPLFFTGDARRGIKHSPELPDAIFLLAVAGNAMLPELPSSVWEVCDQSADQVQATLRWRSINPSPLPYYRFGAPIDFRRGGNAPLYQHSGWDNATEGGTWMLGTHAVLRLCPIEPVIAGMETVLLVDAQGLSGSDRRETLVEFYLNGILIGSGCFSERMTWSVSCRAAARTFGESEWILGVRVLNPTTPKALGIGPDSRSLGLLFGALSLNCTG